MVVNSPLELTETVGQFDIKINVYQDNRHGISLALLDVSTAYRSAGFLTRELRAKERKKYGLKGARRAPQFFKR